jgi:SAM-dependent methyltransferase
MPLCGANGDDAKPYQEDAVRIRLEMAPRAEQKPQEEEQIRVLHSGPMMERQSPTYNLDFSDERLAALYDRRFPPAQRDDFAFYLPLIMAASSVLDVGCGTGALLHLAREAGHTGRLCGLDPAPGMLAQARARSDVEWVLGDLSTVGWDREFDLVVMTGHAFQELINDAEIRTALAAIRAALTEGGRFAFETRNPLRRAWEHWTTQYSAEVTDAAGAVVRCDSHVSTPLDGGVVRGGATYTSATWDQPLESWGMLRFVDAAPLSSFLASAGLAIEEQFGDWDRQSFTEVSPEIITIARKEVTEHRRR